MNLDQLGWNSRFSYHFEELERPDLQPARISREDRGRYTVLCPDGELPAELASKPARARDPVSPPVVGDWVAVGPREGMDLLGIEAVLPRFSTFSRKAAGRATQQQVVAANVDTALLVMGLDNDYNLRRIERFLTLVWESGASPAIVLNKSDLCSDVPARQAEVEEVAMGTPIHVMSATSRKGIAAISEYVTLGRTVAFLGSSGVGKSSIINCFLGEARLETKEVRARDGRGCHTTTWRELIPLPGGGLVIDTPGLRQIQIWADEGRIDAAFADIVALGKECRFRDCTHAGEPGCAVLLAVEEGRLKAGRLHNYHKLKEEQVYLNLRQSERARHEEKLRGRRFGQLRREVMKNNLKYQR